MIISRDESRAWLADRLERGWKRSVALTGYEYSLSLSAKVFSRAEAVRSIEVFGGSERRCRPGISDIDLLVFYDDTASVTEQARLVETLRTRYRGLKKLIPMLGEVHLTSARRWKNLETWGVAPLLWFSPRRTIWASSTPSSDAPRSSPRFTARARFSLAVAHYSSACRALTPALQGSRYALTLFSKEIEKCVAYATATDVETKPLFAISSTLPQLSRAFHALDAIAEKALGETIREEECGPEPHPNADAPDFESIAIEAKDRAIKSVFAPDFPSAASLPFRFPVTRDESERWLAKCLMFRKRTGNALLDIVSHATHECLVRGWAWDRPWESRHFSNGGRHRMLWERLLFHAQSLPGLYLRTEATRKIVTRHFCQEARALLGDSRSAALETLERTNSDSPETALSARDEIERKMAERGFSFFRN